MNRPTDRSGATEVAVWDALRSVVDPELGANLVDLGMIRAVLVVGHTATVELALTMPGCPLAEWLAQQVRSAVLQLSGIQDVDVRIVDSPWPNLPGAPWQRWLDEALTPNHHELDGDTPEPVATPRRSDTEAGPGSIPSLHAYSRD
jgi:metal-sulfur cluster biosynthetic enzyme